MHFSRFARRVLGGFTLVGLAFLYVPLIIVAVLSFNTSRSFSWPPKGITASWWIKALQSQAISDGLIHSVTTAVAASAIALVLGTMASFAVQRFKFFGRETVSFLVILPIALPGIVTGIALNRAFRSLGASMGFMTLVVAHATFCIVVVYNNVIARLRRLSPNLEEASADLGADTFQTFWYVTFPMIRSALLAGALLAFALSFDEIVVTTFTAGPGYQTLPLWIFSNMFRPNNLPLVNVVATAVVLLSIIPVWLAQRLTDGGGTPTAGR
jgi:putative spermidine/putrescine transport system permease protein